MAKKAHTQTRYGIEITKPHSKKMYDHNDAIALDMKRNILSEIHLAYSQAIGNIAAAGGSDAGEKRLRKIVKCFTGYGFEDGYDLEEIKDQGFNTVSDTENWSLHQEYGYLCSEEIVPKLRMKMLGFDKAEDGCWDCYWEDGDVYTSQVQTTDIPGFEGTLEQLDNLTIVDDTQRVYEGCECESLGDCDCDGDGMQC